MPHPARLWLIRHGQTDWNAIGRIQGQSQTPLNAAGKGEAATIAAIIRQMPRTFAACYSSDLIRAAETARVIAAPLGFPVQELPALRERSFGTLEGATRTQVQHARAAAGLPVTADLADWSGLPGIEPNDELYARTAAALRDISARHPASDVLVVTHGGVIGRVLFRTLGIPDSAPRRFPLSNGICAVIEPAGDSFYLLTLADLPLLAGRPPAPDTAMSPPPVPHA